MAKSDNQTKCPTGDVQTVVEIAESRNWRFVGLLFVDKREGNIGVIYRQEVPDEMQGHLSEMMNLHTIEAQKLFQ